MLPMTARARFDTLRQSPASRRVCIDPTRRDDATGRAAASCACRAFGPLLDWVLDVAGLTARGGHLWGRVANHSVTPASPRPSRSPAFRSACPRTVCTDITVPVGRRDGRAREV